MFVSLLNLDVGDDKVKISKFRFFIVKNEKLEKTFLATRRNIAQSTALGEYVSKMPKLFEIGQVVVENEPPKVGRKSKISP